MNLTTQHDIDAPIDYVFGQVTDFAAFETQALRRGADVQRLDGSGPYHVGSTWDVAFSFRGKDRKLHANLTEMDAPNFFQVDTDTSGLSSIAKVELITLSPNTTRLRVEIDMTAKSMAARLLLQSLRLAKGNISKRFTNRVKEFAVGVEDAYKRGA